MQPLRYLMKHLSTLVHAEHYLFMLSDLKVLLPELSDSAFKTLLSRAVKEGRLDRVCRGLYCYKQFAQHGVLLFHAASYLRRGEFNYLSVETVLSEAGVISQIPMNWISVMSSGRSNTISCGPFGTIEFIHTQKKPEDLKDQLVYDARYTMWKAQVPLALKDMRSTHRNLDLIDWEAFNEFI